jgi:hypothetical protein
MNDDKQHKEFEKKFQQLEDELRKAVEEEIALWKKLFADFFLRKKDHKKAIVDELEKFAKD